MEQQDNIPNDPDNTTQKQQTARLGRSFTNSRLSLYTSIHKSTNYEPLALLLGRKLKIPVECHNYGDKIKNVLDSPDISEKKKNNMIEGFQQEHFAALLANKHEIFGQVKSNIDKNQKCQKHYFDIQNEMPSNIVK